MQRIVNASLRNTIEPKVTFLTTDALSVTATGQIVSAIGQISRGDGPINNMTGNLVKPLQWTLRFTYSTAQVFSTVRLLMFQWLDASIPTPAGILQYVGDARAPHSPLLWTNIHKIRKLNDFVRALKPRVASGYDAKYKELNAPGMATVQFSSTSMDVQMNGLYVLLISDDIIGTAPAITMVSEVRFTDA